MRLIPPSYVKPFVTRGKSDSADAEAICEAVARPTMRSVAVKPPEQQAIGTARIVWAILSRGEPYRLRTA